MALLPRSLSKACTRSLRPATRFSPMLSSSQMLSLPRLYSSAYDNSPSAFLGHRFKVTAEIMVSKLIPAGMGWQAFSHVADGMGFAADSFGFALTTGFGDGFGVCCGHIGYKVVQRAVALAQNRSGGMSVVPNLGNEAQTALFLATATLCSGTAWQPTVATLTSLGWGFYPVAIGTATICGTSFFVGLRLGRKLYSGILPAVAGPSYANLKQDAGLSASIGAATGLFVGTDCGFLDNPFQPVLGIAEGTSVMYGCAQAGASTGLGFVALQTVQNTTMPRTKNWMDPDFKA